MEFLVTYNTNHGVLKLVKKRINVLLTAGFFELNASRMKPFDKESILTRR